MDDSGNQTCSTTEAHNISRGVFSSLNSADHSTTPTLGIEARKLLRLLCCTVGRIPVAELSVRRMVVVLSVHQLVAAWSVPLLVAELSVYPLVAELLVHQSVALQRLLKARKKLAIAPHWPKLFQISWVVGRGGWARWGCQGFIGR
jgi:hypothetical protein